MQGRKLDWWGPGPEDLGKKMPVAKRQAQTGRMRVLSNQGDPSTAINLALRQVHSLNTFQSGVNVYDFEQLRPVL